MPADMPVSHARVEACAHAALDLCSSVGWAAYVLFDFLLHACLVHVAATV